MFCILFYTILAEMTKRVSKLCQSWQVMTAVKGRSLAGAVAMKSKLKTNGVLDIATFKEWAMSIGAETAQWSEISTQKTGHHLLKGFNHIWYIRHKWSILMQETTQMLLNACGTFPAVHTEKNPPGGRNVNTCDRHDVKWLSLLFLSSQENMLWS